MSTACARMKGDTFWRGSSTICNIQQLEKSSQYLGCIWIFLTVFNFSSHCMTPRSCSSMVLFYVVVDQSIWKVLEVPAVSNIMCRLRHTFTKIMEIRHESKKWFGQCSYERSNPTSPWEKVGQRLFFTSNWGFHESNFIFFPSLICVIALQSLDLFLTSGLTLQPVSTLAQVSYCSLGVQMSRGPCRAPWWCRYLGQHMQKSWGNWRQHVSLRISC